MIFQLHMFCSLGVFLVLSAVGIQFGAPLWFFIASVALSLVLGCGLLLLTLYVDDVFEERARAKRRAAAAVRRAKGEAL